MLIYAFLLILLLLRPSWGLLGFFTIVAAALWALLGIGQAQGSPIVLAVSVLIQGTIFFGVGAIIVAVRTWMQSRKSGEETRTDELVAKARAEAESGARPPNTPT